MTTEIIGITVAGILLTIAINTSKEISYLKIVWIKK